MAKMKNSNLLSKMVLQRLVFIFIGTLMISAAASLIRTALDWVAKAHWLAGLILSLVFLGVLIVVIKWISRQPLSKSAFGKYPMQGLILNLFAVIFVAVVVIAIISNTLFYSTNIVQYTSSDPITIGKFMDYYFWHFLDSIPVLDIWSVFDVEAPIQGTGFWAGSLVLVFRITIITPIIIIAKRHLNFSTKTSASEPST